MDELNTTTSATNEKLCADCNAALERNNRWFRCAKCRERCRQKAAITRKRRKASGLCAACGKVPFLPTRSCCQECLNALSERVLIAQKGRIQRGLCYRCGKTDATVDASRRRSQRRVCEVCYFRIKANHFLERESLWRTLRDKLIAQNYTCPYSGERIVLGVNDSIDHILPRSRYPELAHHPANLEWVTFSINLMKHDLSKEQFLATVGKIAAYTAP